MIAYKKAYELGCDSLNQAGIEEYILDARILLEHICKTNRNTLLAHPEQVVTAEQFHMYKKAIEDRAKHIPLQHITGEQEFMGLTFKVSKDVLIPRQDTEVLVEEAMRYLHDGMSVLDMCTGSGCILISLLRYSNDCIGVGVDISKEALEIARENARVLLPSSKALSQEALEDEQQTNCSKYVFLQSDMFQNVKGQYDILVSNPPYIPSHVIETLMPEVREHEPSKALDGMEDGLFFYRHLAVYSKFILKPQARYVWERAYDKGQGV